MHLELSSVPLTEAHEPRLHSSQNRVSTEGRICTVEMSLSTKTQHLALLKGRAEPIR